MIVDGPGAGVKDIVTPGRGTPDTVTDEAGAAANARGVMAVLFGDG